MSASKPNAPPARGDAPTSSDNKVSRVLRGGVTRVTNTTSDFVNRHVSSERRQQWTEQLKEFWTARPYLAGFLLSQLAISIVPVLLMTLFVLSCALSTALLLATLGVFLFVSAVMGLASLVLLPILVFASIAAGLFWFWGSIAILVMRWLQRRDREGVSAGHGLQHQIPRSMTAPRISSPLAQSTSSDIPPETSPTTSAPDEDHSQENISRVQSSRLAPDRTPSSSPSPPISGIATEDRQDDEKPQQFPSVETGDQRGIPSLVHNSTTSNRAQTNENEASIVPG